MHSPLYMLFRKIIMIKKSRIYVATNASKMVIAKRTVGVDVYDESNYMI